MLERGIISKFQLFLMMIILVNSTGVLYLPDLMFSIGGRDGWLSPLVAGLMGVIVFLTMYYLNQEFPDQTPVEFMQTLFGRWVGGVLALFLIWQIWHTFAVTLREFSDFTITVTLSRTPPDVILLLILLVVYYGVVAGLEVVARVVQFIMLVEMIQLVLSVIVFASKDVNLNQIRPFMEHGIVPVLQSSALLSNWYGELILVGFFLPFLKSKKGVIRAGIISITVTTFLFLISLIYTVGVFGPEITGRLQYGVYELARYVSVANFFERLDPIISGVWIMLIYGKMLILCYCVSYGLAFILRLRSYRPLVSVVCLGAFTLSQQEFRSLSELLDFISHPFVPFGILILIVFPLFLLVYAKIRKKWRSIHAPKKIITD